MTDKKFESMEEAVAYWKKEDTAVPVSITMKPAVLRELDSLAKEFNLSRSATIAVLVQMRASQSLIEEYGSVHEN